MYHHAFVYHIFHSLGTHDLYFSSITSDWLEAINAINAEGNCRCQRFQTIAIPSPACSNLVTELLNYVEKVSDYIAAVCNKLASFSDKSVLTLLLWLITALRPHLLWIGNLCMLL